MQLGLLFQFWYYVPKNKNEEILSMFLYFFDFDTKSTICSCGRVRYPHRILSYSTNCHCHSKVRRSKQLPTSTYCIVTHDNVSFDRCFDSNAMEKEVLFQILRRRYFRFESIAEMPQRIIRK